MQPLMASLQNPRRRPRDGHPEDHPRAKRRQLSTRRRPAPNFSPSFWDRLSKVWLTPRALREVDRRNDARRALGPATSLGLVAAHLGRFARGGGPDLGHLRGFPKPKVVQAMTSSSRSASSQCRRTQSTRVTTVSSRARQSSAYHDEFEQHLLDHDVFTKGYEHSDGRSTPEPTNLDSIHQALRISRASLSPSCFSESAFRDFKRKSKTNSEGTVMRSLVPVVAGTAEIPNEGHLPFANLESLTNEATVKAVPDFFDGAHPETIDKEVGQAMSQMIIPTKHTAVPAVPNFFLEAKASKGGAHVALRQACLDGAYGARAVDALWSYAEAEPAYDGSASAYSSTLHDGTLKLFAHHVMAPRTALGRPEYHMTQLRSFGMTDSRETFIAGASAFRNARDLAKSDRDSALWVANRRASRAGASAAEEHRTESRAQAVFRRSPVASARPTACKEAHDARGQQVAVDHQGNRAKWAAPDRTDGRASFVSSLSSTFTDGTVRCKRLRQAFGVDSSPPVRRRPSKSRRRP